MANILDYLKWRGDLTFSERPFNDVDALILAQLSYLNFDGLLFDGDFSYTETLFNLSEKFRNSPDFEKRCDLGALINKKTVQLLFDVATSERFGVIKVCGYTSKIDLEGEEQFSAITFILPEKNNLPLLENSKNFVAFRGTDDTIVGWKEDFNLAIKDEVPAQFDAVKYLEKAAKSLKGEFLVGGHSKGGNLSIYAAANVEEKIKNRIKIIYNLDGPGFSEKKLKSNDFTEIIPKIRSYYPHFSIVGMIFDHAGEYSVVESDESGIMQHDPFSWHVLKEHFVKLDGFDKNAKFLNETFNDWICAMEQTQREKFIEIFFNLVSSTNAKTNSEIEENLLKNFVTVLKELSKLNPEDKEILEKASSLMFKTVQSKIPTFSQVVGKIGIKPNKNQ